jgi:cell division protein FtsN
MRTIKDFANKPRVNFTSPRVPWFKKVLMVALLMLLVAVLVFLLREKFAVEVEGSFIDQTDTPVIEAVAQVVKPEPKLKPKVLEQASASDFTYGVILKQTEVKPAHVKVYESTAKDPTKKTNHVLQVASFKSERDAKELQSKLIKKKLANVQVTQSTAKSGSVWYRVMVGPFQNRSMLNKAQDTLVQMNFSPLERKR